MPPGLDPAQDQDFLKAPSQEQHAYLMSADADYAKAPPNEQKAYLGHVAGMYKPKPESSLVANRPAKPASVSNPMERSDSFFGRGVQGARDEVAGNEQVGREYLERGPKEFYKGAMEVAGRAPGQKESQIAHGFNRMVSGAGVTAAPAIMNALPMAAVEAPVATAASLGVGTAAQTGTEEGLKYLGANPDTAKAAGNVTGLAAGMYGPKMLSAARETMQPALDVAKKGMEFIPRSVGLIKPEPAKALTQAIQPGINIPRAGESIETAGPRIQHLKTAGLITDEEGNPLTEIKNNKDLLQAVKAGKRYIWDAVEQRLGKVDVLQADTSSVGRAMVSAIPKRIATQFPDVAARIAERASTYNDTMSLRDIEEAIQSANNDLKNFYKQPVANDKPISADTAATEAEVKGLRTLLDEKVQKLTGSGVKDLKREYGALRDMEKAAAKQALVQARQKGASLYEGLAALRAAGDFVTGNPLGAAKGVATLAMGRRLANVRSPDWLIDQAFQGPKAFGPAAEIAKPPGPNIRGLLPPGPVPLGSVPDDSGPVKLPTQQAAEGTRATRKGLLLPPAKGPLVTPRPEGTSGPVKLPISMVAEGTSESRPTIPTAATKQPPTNGAIKAAKAAMAPKAPEKFVSSRTPPAENKMPPAKVEAKPTPRSESLTTYNSLTPEQKAVVDSQASELPHMPQALREGRMKQLESYGGKGTFLKEKLAKEHLEYEKQSGGQPGEKAGEPSNQDAGEIKRLQQRERDLIEKSSRARNWVTGNKMIRQAKEVNERWNAIKRGLKREPGED